MRPGRQSIIISMQVELLEDTVSQIESVLSFSKQAIANGKCWLESTVDSQPFWKVNQSLANEISYLLEKFRDIAVSDANHGGELDVNHLEEGNSFMSGSISIKDCPKSMCQQRFDELDEVQSSLQYLEHQYENQFYDLHKKFEEYKTRFENENEQFKYLKKDLSLRIDQVDTDLNSVKEKIDIMHHVDIKDTVEQRIQSFMTGVKEQIDNLLQTVEDVQEHCDHCDVSLEKLAEAYNRVLASVTSLRDTVAETDYKLQMSADKLDHVICNVNCLNTRYSEDFNHLQREFKNGDEQMKMSHLLLFKRLTLLETSRDRLCREVFSWSNISNSQMSDMKRYIKSIRKQCKEIVSASDPLGFTAYIPSGGRTVRLMSNSDMNLKCFMNVLCNRGGHYDPASGKFKAPSHGLYVVSLCVSVMAATHVKLIAVRELGGKKYCVTSTGSRVHGTSSSSVALTELKAGEEVYVTSSCDSGAVVLGDLSYFTCFLLKNFSVFRETNSS